VLTTREREKEKEGGRKELLREKQFAARAMDRAAEIVNAVSAMFPKPSAGRERISDVVRFTRGSTGSSVATRSVKRRFGLK